MTDTRTTEANTLRELRHEFGDRWDVAEITGGYRATIKGPGGTPIPRYGRTLAELAESIRNAEAQAMKPWAWEVFCCRPAPTPGLLAELSQLRTALPGYDVVVTSHSLTYRFEAIRRPTGPQHGPWCLISTDPADLWRELAPYAQASADAGARAARAP